MKKEKQYRSNLFIYLFYLETMDTRLNAFVMLPLSSLRFAMRDLRPRKHRFRAAVHNNHAIFVSSQFTSKEYFKPFCTQALIDDTGSVLISISDLLKQAILNLILQQY